MPGGNIGDWTQSKLVRFLGDFIRDNAPTNLDAVSVNEIDVNDRLTIIDEIQFSAEQASATGGSPAKYFRVLDGAGNVYVIPAYLP